MESEGRSAASAPPYSSYAVILGAFAGGLAAAGALARSLDREPQAQTALDFALLAGATFKTARTLTHDRVASFVRQPFVESEAGQVKSAPPATVHAGRSANWSPAHGASARGPRPGSHQRSSSLPVSGGS